MERCAECRQLFQKTEMMQFSDFYVCPKCKPLAVAKISRGEAVGSIWRFGTRLVVLRDGELPDRCVHCNQPAYGYRLKKTFRWQHPASYLLLVGLVLGLQSRVQSFSIVIIAVFSVISLCLQKSSRTSIPLCPRHRNRRLMTIFICNAVALSGIGFLALSIFNSSGPYGLVSAGLIVVGLISGLFLGPPLRPTRITRTHAFFSGAGEQFLEEQPKWPGH
jgi:hypothetical protein